MDEARDLVWQRGVGDGSRERSKLGCASALVVSWVDQQNHVNPGSLCSSLFCSSSLYILKQKTKLPISRFLLIFATNMGSAEEMHTANVNRSIRTIKAGTRNHETSNILRY